MCRKVTALLTLMITLLSISGCNHQPFGDSDMDIYEKIHAYYNKMERYSANVAFTCYSNKTENHYTATQKAMGNDKHWIKVQTPEENFSVTTVTNGDKTKTLADGSGYAVTVPTNDVTNFLFINQFFSRYYASEDTCLSVVSHEKGNVTLLETPLFPVNNKDARITLSIDNKTLAPVNLTVYSHGGNVTLSATFSDFKYNDKAIKDSDFTTD